MAPKKTPKKKLAVKKQTVRKQGPLDEGELINVAGGVYVTPSPCAPKR